MYIDGFDMKSGFNRLPANLTENIDVNGENATIADSYIGKNLDPFYQRFEND